MAGRADPNRALLGAEFHEIELPVKEEEYVDRFGELFRESVGIHLMSDVPLGCFSQVASIPGNYRGNENDEVRPSRRFPWPLPNARPMS